MDSALPKIRVTDAHRQTTNVDADTEVRSPLPTTASAPELSTRPPSANSSNQIHSQAAPIGKKVSAKVLRDTPAKEQTKESIKDTRDEAPSSPPERPPTAIDPLSHHILKRTNTENTIPQKLRNAAPEGSKVDQASPESKAPSRQQTPDISRTDSFQVKEKKKGVSFLSRFNIGGKKKDQQNDDEDDESETGDHRTEGMNASVFSSAVGANGYIPQHKEPPRYIKVRAHNKKDREFDRMFLAQELSGSKHTSSDEKVPGLTTSEIPAPHAKLSKVNKANGAVWATEFSKDGKYLAAAGRDQVVRVWAVISTPEERLAHEYEEDISSGASGPERLSAPVFRSKPVREFEGHTGDILDLSWSKNNFLLSSSMDKTVRLWHISRQENLCTFKHKDFVTSIAFHPKDDRFFLAGSLDSVLRLWSIPDKSVAFWNQLPDLITAVAFTPDGKTAMAGVLSGLCLFYETEGLKYHTQIHVRSSRGKNAKGSKITGIRTMTFPPDDPEGETKVLITSNDSRVRIYNLRDKSLEMKFRGHENTCSQIHASFSDDGQYVICGSEDRKAYIWSMTQSLAGDNKDKRPLELFEAHSDIVTTSIMAPTKSRQLLSASGDPLYDLCNPPPITLLSREESIASVAPTPVMIHRHASTTSDSKRPEESPAYLARCSHLDGNIIITADLQGGIKVFRQDCAFNKRRSDHWETSSMFSKKMLGRSNSIMTRNSGGSHSRRSSIASPSIGSDHILSWRNSVNSTSSIDAALKYRGDRSVSPGKFSKVISHSNPNLASTARTMPYASTPLAQNISTSPPISHASQKTPKAKDIATPPTPGFSLVDDNPLRLDATGKSYQFWNVSSWNSNAGTNAREARSGEVKPVLKRDASSYVSQLTSSESGSGSGSGSEEGLTCKGCGGRDFRARKGGGRLICGGCGVVAS